MVGEVIDPLRIKLQEYGAPVIRDVKDINLHALAEANKRWSKSLGLSSDPIRVEDIGDGLVKLRAEAVTGVVRVGDTDIEIAPKFLSVSDGNWQTVLWRILTVVEGGHVDDNVTTAHELASMSMPDLLAEMFLASYAKGAARGLPRGYLIEKATGTTLRGSLDTSRLDEWVTRPWQLPYATDLLSDDTPLARLLRWSAECLAATVKAPGRSRAVREIAAGLAHVGRQPPHLLDAQRIPLGIQHQGLETARVVGLLLLEGAGVHHAKGYHSLSGFLWNSDVIYEHYVYWLCQRAAGQRGKRIDKRTAKFGEVISGAGPRLETTPDVTFRDAQGVPFAVTDSKYKRLGLRPKASDTYQVLAAGHVLGCQRVSLTYPVAQDREPTVWRVSSALGGHDIELTALPLNIMSLAKANGSRMLVERVLDWLDGEYAAPVAVTKTGSATVRSTASIVMSQVLDQLGTLFGDKGATDDERQSLIEGSMRILLRNEHLRTEAAANTTAQFAESLYFRDELLSAVAKDQGVRGEILDLLYSGSPPVEVLVGAFAGLYHQVVKEELAQAGG